MMISDEEREKHSPLVINLLPAEVLSSALPDVSRLIKQK
jgi:hypothetical protein